MHNELLGNDDGEEERDPEDSRYEIRCPKILRVEDVVLVEVEDRASEAALDGRGQLTDDRADDARCRGDSERTEQVRQ